MKTKKINIKGREIEVCENGTLALPEWVDARGRRRQRRETVGFYNWNGYRKVSLSIDGAPKKFFVHRLVAEAFLPEWNESLEVDHRNGKKDDNRVSNLRMVTHKQNGRASKKAFGAVPYRGVRREPRSSINPFQAQIRLDGKYHYLGLFPTAEKAARAFDKAAIKFGFFPEALNFPPNLATNA